MAVKVIELKDLAKEIGAMPNAMLDQIKVATRKGLLRAIPHMVAKSPVDTGQYAASWDFTETEKSMILYNSAPHAAIIEYGARPFTPPIGPLLMWAKRVLKDPSQPPDYSPKVRSLAYGVRAKIQAEGMKPRKILENEIPTILNFIKQELDAIR